MFNTNSSKECQERQAKHQAYAEQQARGECGANQCTDKPYPEVAELGFMDSLRSKLRRSQQESRNLTHLDELIWLLEKNPEIARILELVKLVGI